MNAPLMTTATAAPAAAQARPRSDARCAPLGQAPGGAASARCGPGDDEALFDGLAAPGEAGLLAPPPGLLGAWQAALLAREQAPSAHVAGAAGAAATGEHSSTQQAVSAVAQAQGPEAGPRSAAAGVLPSEALPLRIEAEFRPGAGPAWQLGLQRGPDAATWSLHLATSAVPAAWGATQLPRLERRLRLQGHTVDAHWGARSGPPEQPGEHDER